MVTVDIENPVTQFLGLLHFTLHYVSHTGYYSTYLKEIVIKEGKNSFTEHLILDIEMMRMVQSHIETEKRDSIVIDVAFSLYHAKSDNSLVSGGSQCTVSAFDYKKSFEKEKKLEATGLRSTSILGPHLSRDIAHIQDILGPDRIEIKVLSGMVGYVKDLVLQDADVKAAGSMKSLESYAQQADLNKNWVIAAVLLALHELMVKKVLSKKGIKVKDRNFSELVDELRVLLQENEISYDEMQLSDLKGKRDYRHKVIHEGLQPDDNGLTKIVDESARLMILLKQLRDKLKV